MTATGIPAASATRPPKPRRRSESGAARSAKKALTSRTATIAAVLIAAVWTVPTLGLLVSSFRTSEEARTSGWWTIFSNPSFTLDNYVDVFTVSGAASASLGSYFANSFAITIPGTIFPIAFATMAAYALAWIRFRGANILFVVIFALQIVPLQMALIPLLQIFSQALGISGTIPAVWLAHTVFGLPLMIFLMHNFISEIPHDIIEAARVDGANHSQIFLRIILPLSMPALASVGIFQFLWVWNDLLVALVFSGGTPDVAPLTQRLAEMAGNFGRFQARLPAAAFVSIIVPVIVFFALQRYFVRGLLSGSTKG